jgi:anti-sigma factor (TIGR02949 family)
MMQSSDGTPMRDCHGAMEKLFDLLDGELTPERVREMIAHINGCSACFKHADFEKRFLEAVAKARGAGAAPSALRSRVENALRADGWTGASA